MKAITPDRWLFFRTQDEADRWRKAMDAAGLQATVAVWDAPLKDERGYWQPPRVFWRDYRCPKCGQTFHLYFIDGFWYQNNDHVDYAEGGHHLVYSDIPDDCIYLEPSYLEHTENQRIIAEEHECPENCDMATIYGCFYEEAHGMATRNERNVREQYREVPAAPIVAGEGEEKARTDRKRRARLPLAAILSLGVM